VAAGQAALNVLECPAAGSRVVGFAHAVDGGGFATTEGEEVRLAGIVALGEGGISPVPSLDAARDMFERVLRGRTVSLAAAERSRDRYGRTVAQVFADDIWVQRALLQFGQARAAPDFASAPCANALLAAETEGRDLRRGLWRDGTFRVRRPEDLGNRIGSFQIVEGTVTTASLTRGRAFINFGADYRTDFTVTIGPEDMRAFRQAKFDVEALAGKRIRVRGWVEFYNGPEIAIATPAAIELLER